MQLEAPGGFRGVFRGDADARAVYSEAAGIGRIMPAAVAVPVDANDISVLVRWARESGIPVVPRGSGSSMAGGAIGEGVVLDVSRLRDHDEPDADARTIHVGAGVLRGELNVRAERVGLRLPVDPSSGEFCTIGGMIGTNAAGPRSLRHGSMRSWVVALDCVFEDGAIAEVRRGSALPDVAALRRFMRTAHPILATRQTEWSAQGVLKNSSGYGIQAYAQTLDPVDLLVGSEGTLCVFTGATIALAPVASARRGLLVSFASLDAAVAAASLARHLGAAACELLDGTFLRLAASAGVKLPVSGDSEAVLIVDVEAENVIGATACVEELRARFRRLGAIDLVLGGADASDADLWAFRHAASPAIARMDARLRSMQFIEDAAVPPEALAAYVRGVRAIVGRANTEVVIFGHAGDAHVHVNPLVDVGKPGWRAMVEGILLDVTELVVSLGGTLSGEHGDGRLRTPLLDRVWSAEERESFELIKRSFDPSGVFNPGVKIPIAGRRPMDDIKYDPALPELPAASRRALSTVERDRAYSKFRLDLL